MRDARYMDPRHYVQVSASVWVGGQPTCEASGRGLQAVGGAFSVCPASAAFSVGSGSVALSVGSMSPPEQKT